MQEYALKNYDLSDYRNLLSDQCVNIYHTIVKTIQDDLQPMIGNIQLYKHLIVMSIMSTP